MQAALEQAQLALAAGEVPIGAVLVVDGAVVARGYNRPIGAVDPTAHAEVNAIREAARKLRTIDFSGCTIYTTCEPCPMCLTAIHWAKFDRVVFGASIADAAEAGFFELKVSAKDLVKDGGSPLVVEAGLCQANCQSLFQLWKETAKGRAY